MSRSGRQVPFLDLRAAYGETRAETDEAVHRVLEGGWYIRGTEVDAFEREFAAYSGSRHCVGVSNGLDALSLVLRAWDIGPGDEVLVPSHTFIATWLAVANVGARPVPVEVDPATYSLDPGRVEGAVTPRTRAVVPVHLYGRPAPITSLMDIAEQRGIRVLADAAQSHGSRVDGEPTPFGHAAGVSFYPGKNLGAVGDGGAVLTDDDELVDRVRMLANYGSRRKYDHELQGVNCRLDELQAAVLRIRLRYLDEWNARRRAIAGLYSDAFRDVDGLTLPPSDDATISSSWHLYVVAHPARDALQAHLASCGVETLVHYPVPPHRSAAFASLGLAAGSLPIAEHAADHVLSLPIGPHMSPAQVEAVVRAVCSFTPPEGD